MTAFAYSERGNLANYLFCGVKMVTTEAALPAHSLLGARGHSNTVRPACFPAKKAMVHAGNRNPSPQNQLLQLKLMLFLNCFGIRGILSLQKLGILRSHPN